MKFPVAISKPVSVEYTTVPPDHDLTGMDDFTDSAVDVGLFREDCGRVQVE